MGRYRLVRIVTGTVILAWIATAGWLCLIQAPPTWDGGDHSFHALRIHQALQHMDPGLMNRFTREQNLWPFLHSWITGIFLWIFGGSFLTIRCVSLLAALLTMLLTAGFTHHYQTVISSGTRADPDTDSAPAVSLFSRSWGWLSAFILAGSPIFFLYAVQPMLEIFGAAVTIAVLWCVAAAYVPTRREPSRNTSPSPSVAGFLSRRNRLNTLAGLLLVAAFFIKYIYAILLVASLAVTFGYQWFCGMSRRVPDARRGSFLPVRFIDPVLWFAPVTGAAAIWFSRAPALKGFLVFRDNPDTGFGLLDPVNWIIYPVTVLLYYCSTPLLGFLGIWLAIRASRFRPSPFTALAGVYFLTTLIMLTIYRYKLIRAPFTVIPCLAFLTAAGIAHLYRHPIRNRRTDQTVRAAIVLALVVNGGVAALPREAFRYVPIWKNEIDYMLNFDSKLAPALSEIGSRITDTRDLCITGEFNAVSSLQLAYFIRTAHNEILDPIPSLFAWNQPRESVNLVPELHNRGFRRCLILSVRPGSVYDTPDYIEKFAWMSRHLVRPSPESEFHQVWSLAWDNGLTAEFWDTR
ncbi:MAG TPA: hypothetical protein PLV45_05265 [bacterium]|nr:hypothetical protein [bacterium]